MQAPKGTWLWSRETFASIVLGRAYSKSVYPDRQVHLWLGPRLASHPMNERTWKNKVNCPPFNSKARHRAKPGKNIPPLVWKTRRTNTHLRVYVPTQPSKGKTSPPYPTVKSRRKTSPPLQSLGVLVHTCVYTFLPSPLQEKSIPPLSYTHKVQHTLACISAYISPQNSKG